MSDTSENEKSYLLQNQFNIERLLLYVYNSDGTIRGNYPLQHVYHEIQLFHDIDGAASSGYVTIIEKNPSIATTDSSDEIGLILALPIRGWERLDIKFSIPTKEKQGNSETNSDENNFQDPYEHSFFVYAVDNVIYQTDAKIYTLRFADLSALINISSRIEQRFIGKAEDIIGFIADSEIFNNNTIERIASTNDKLHGMPFKVLGETKYELDLISPSWKPFKFLNKVRSLGVSKYGSFGDCLLIPQVDGVYEFTNYFNLANTQVSETETFLKTESPTLEPNSENNKNTPIAIRHKYIVENYTYDKLFNNQLSAVGGMFGSITKEFDFSDLSYTSYTTSSGVFGLGKDRKSLIKHTNNKDRLVSTSNQSLDAILLKYSLNKNFLFNNNENESSDLNYAIKGFPESAIQRTFYGTSQSEVENAKNNKQKNKLRIRESISNSGMFINMLRSQNIVFTLAPCTDLRLGQKIKFNDASLDSKSTLANGYWIISKINYVIKQNSFKVHVEAYRNL